MSEPGEFSLHQDTRTRGLTETPMRVPWIASDTNTLIAKKNDGTVLEFWPGVGDPAAHALSHQAGGSAALNGQLLSGLRTSDSPSFTAGTFGVGSIANWASNAAYTWFGKVGKNGATGAATAGIVCSSLGAVNLFAASSADVTAWIAGVDTLSITASRTNIGQGELQMGSVKRISAGGGFFGTGLNLTGMATNGIAKFDGSGNIGSSAGFTFDGVSFGIGLNNAINNPKIWIQNNTALAGGPEINLFGAAGPANDENSNKLILGNCRLILTTSPVFKFQRYDSAGSAWNTIFATSSSSATSMDLTFYGALTLASLASNFGKIPRLIDASGKLGLSAMGDDGTTITLSRQTTVSAALTANSFVKNGGASSQVLMADGSVNSRINYVEGLYFLVTGDMGTSDMLGKAVLRGTRTIPVNNLSLGDTIKFKWTGKKDAVNNSSNPMSMLFMVQSGNAAYTLNPGLPAANKDFAIHVEADITFIAQNTGYKDFIVDIKITLFDISVGGTQDVYSQKFVKVYVYSINDGQNIVPGLSFSGSTTGAPRQDTCRIYKEFI